MYKRQAYQSEAALEQAFIRMLEEQGYAYLPIHDNADLVTKMCIRDRFISLF